MPTLEPRRPARLRWAPVAVLAGTALLYTWRLGEAPVYISNDEVHFAIHAESIATTGRALNGERFPLFVEMIDPLLPDNRSTAWWQPLLFYATSASLLILPFTEATVRLPVAIISMLNVGLVYAIARQRFGSRAPALAAAALLALTPAHFVMGRQALDYLAPVPFALAWLWCLGGFLARQDPRLLTAGGLALGVGTFSHISAWALMPLLAAITGVVLAITTRAPRAWIAFGAGLLTPWLLAALWLLMHPGVFQFVVGRFVAVGTTPAPIAAASFADQASRYWDYFSPSFLFFSGGANPTQATSRAGVFLLPMAALLPLGVWAMFRVRRRAIDMVLLAVFLLAPLPVVFVMGAAGGYAVARVLLLVPLGVLVASHALCWLWQRGRQGRLVAIVLLVLAPAQFASFAADYFSDYQLRVAPRLDALNTAGAAAVVFAEDDRARIPLVYLSDDLDSKAVRWRFHLWKATRHDLWSRTRYFTPDLVEGGVEPGSLVVMFHNDPLADRLLASGAFDRLATVTHPSGDPASVVLQRRR